MSETDPKLLVDLERLVDEDRRGDPESLLLWTSKSVRHLTGGLRGLGHQIEYVTVAKLLRSLGYSLQAAPSALVADRQPQKLTELAAGLKPADFQTLAYTTRDGQQVCSRFAMLRVICAHPIERDGCEPREDWLIIEWPEDAEQPSDYWISNMPADTPPERLARVARLRWMIELDYRQLKGELGLDHYEGRSYKGFHHHCAIVTATHGFLTMERRNPTAQRPA